MPLRLEAGSSAAGSTVVSLPSPAWPEATRNGVWKTISNLTATTSPGTARRPSARYPAPGRPNQERLEHSVPVQPARVLPQAGQRHLRLAWIYQPLQHGPAGRLDVGAQRPQGVRQAMQVVQRPRTLPGRRLLAVAGDIQPGDRRARAVELLLRGPQLFSGQFGGPAERELRVREHQAGRRRRRHRLEQGRRHSVDVADPAPELVQVGQRERPGPVRRHRDEQVVPADDVRDHRQRLARVGLGDDPRRFQQRRPGRRRDAAETRAFRSGSPPRYRSKNAPIGLPSA